MPLTLELDHIVIVVPELAAAMRYFEETLGVVPKLGGKHVDFGTHNALFGLGPTSKKQYVELLAFDPDRKPGISEFPFQLEEDSISEIGLLTWGAHCNDIKTAVELLSQNEMFDYTQIQAMSRQRPDGTQIHWKFTFNAHAQALQTKRTIPFLMEWGGDEHPTNNLEQENFCEEFEFIVYTPMARQVDANLKQENDSFNKIFQASDQFNMKLSLKNKEHAITI